MKIAITTQTKVYNAQVNNGTLTSLLSSIARASGYIIVNVEGKKTAINKNQIISIAQEL